MARTLILKIQGNKYVNHSFFRPFLYIYDDIMVYTKRHHVFKVDEITMPYNHVAQVNLHRGLFFSRFDIDMSGGNNTVVIKGIWNRPAKKAKKLIDSKVYQTHNKQPEEHGAKVHAMESIERGLGRLKELLYKEKISQKEFEKRKKELLSELNR